MLLVHAPPLKVEAQTVATAAFQAQAQAREPQVPVPVWVRVEGRRQESSVLPVGPRLHRSTIGGLL
jgi:hypothetical protein